VFATIEHAQGVLQKRSRQGRWNTRFFRLNNLYLVYYKKGVTADPASQSEFESRRGLAVVTSETQPDTAIDLQATVSAELTDRFGGFELTMADG